ncbi:MAG: DUF1553 domain-containing protein, partial [Verrucomicrobiota bacterium]
RRLAYARHLTRGDHPLTGRAFVNRLWLHHFGRGLVSTPGDFGLAGEKPSHPRLLDWLAGELVRQDWDQKRLHRLIVSSRTYRQQSARRADHEAVDPENRLLARASLRRLEAEAIRDAILAVSGQLNTALGGPSLPVTENGEGKVVIGTQIIKDGIPVGADGGGADPYRRSAYVEVNRRLPLNVLATFGQPAMIPNCDQRRHATVSTQALWFLNDQLMVGQAETLAWDLETTLVHEEERLNQLFLRLFSRPPTEEERRSCQEFMAEQKLSFSSDEKEPGSMALASLCQVLLASNRFLYID